MALLVRMANFAVAHSGRTVDWLHLAGPRYLRSEDRSFFRPLADLEPGDARVFLGIVLPIDGVAGLRRRQATASRYLSGFGVAMYCGFGRQPGADGTETMREHARVVRTAREPRPRPPSTGRRDVPVGDRGGTARLRVVARLAEGRHRLPGQQLHRLADHHVTGRLPLDPGDQLVHRRAAEFGQRHGHAGHRDLEEGQALVLVEAHHRHLPGHARRRPPGAPP